jgi:hypothetical protein
MDITPKLEKQARTIAVKIRHLEGTEGVEEFIATGSRHKAYGQYLLTFQEYASLVNTTNHLLKFAEEIINIVHLNVATQGL